MFYAFVIACAAQFNTQLDNSYCAQITDSWGPYKTEENCEIRKNQMMNEILNRDGYIFQLLNYPDMIQLEGHCVFLPEGEKI